MDAALVGAIVGAGVAGVLTPLGTVLANSFQNRRSDRERQKDAHLRAAAEVLSCLQALNREFINIARADVPDKHNADNQFWKANHDAATRWNSARYVAALYCSQSEIQLITDMDHEFDKLLDLACSQVWNPREFRQHRTQLGILAARFLVDARRSSGQARIDLPSVWAWDETRAAFEVYPWAEDRTLDQ